MNLIRNYIVFFFTFAACSNAVSAASLNYGPESCGHAFQGIEVHLTNGAAQKKKFTINVLMKPANGEWSNKTESYNITAHSKRHIGCTKGNVFPPLSMEYKITSIENI